MKNVFLAFVAIALATPAAAQTAGPFKTEKREVALETVVRGLDQAWALAFLPDGRMMVTEKSGRIRIVGQNGAVSEPLAGAPTVAARGQGGLLDLVLDPDFARSRLVFATFAEPRSDGAGTAVIRMRLNDAGTGFEQQNVIFGSSPPTRAAIILARASSLIAAAPSSSRSETASTCATRRRTGRTRLARSCASTATGRSLRTIPETAAKAGWHRSGRSDTATSRPRRCIRKPVSSGRRSMARAAATRSTCRRRARITGGR